MLPGLRVPAALTRTPFLFSSSELNEISKISTTNPADGVSSAMFVKTIMVIKIGGFMGYKNPRLLKKTGELSSISFTFHLWGGREGLS